MNGVSAHAKVVTQNCLALLTMVRHSEKMLSCELKSESSLDIGNQSCDLVIPTSRTMRDSFFDHPVVAFCYGTLNRQIHAHSSSLKKSGQV